MGFYHSLFSQTIDIQLIGCYGHYTLSNGIEYSWSVGETVTETYQQSGQVLTQGFHQPLIIVPSSSVLLENKESCSLFPVPANQSIHIQFDQIEDRTIQIESVLGQVLIRQRSTQSQYQFAIDKLLAATYIVRSINHKNQSITTLTFIKY